ncbi:head-tail connector protein [Ihubacter massiliensis]|uniref:head-tail connector protein n=1 Tax=Ihubacter massiliensis TaxID=1852367 RepID=UPI002096A105|nr:head-tail connector protein [Ihubacter massiliensis]MCI7301317.1 head-tail connector protein [Clostridia bacterium]MCO7120589.1 head-tail connector protein [Ihubacter massiliensis]MDY3010603.1 head-tail connector protein [Clostridiales Family XIII bacterium]
MKPSELDVAYIANYLRIDEPDENTIKELQEILSAALNFAKSYTGLNDKAVDEIPEMTIAVLTLIGDMYDNRQFQIDKTMPINRTTDMILSMHSVNLL